MAKARDITGLDAQTPYGVVAAAVVRVRAGEIREHAAAALDLADIEGVHDTRVATRRLRAALEVFRPCFSPAEYRVVLKEVKAIADALGRRRDLDVKLAALTEAAEGLEARTLNGVASLFERLAEEQIAANVALRPFVEPDRIEALVALVDELARAAEAGS